MPPPPAPSLTFDATGIYPSARDVDAACRAGDWDRAVWIMNQTDPSERCGLVSVAADAANEAMLTEQLSRRPDDALAAAVLATIVTGAAWKVRGNGRASTVSKDQFATFHEMLQRADLICTDALVHNPYDPSLWAASLDPARGLGLGLSEAEYRYQQVKRVSPHVRTAQSSHLQFLCPKWYGTWELADRFAQTCLRESPPGSLDGATIPDVYIEHLLPMTAKDAQPYLKKGVMRQAVWEAAQHSIWHPAFAPRYGWVETLHTFAMAFALLGDQRNAVATLDRCGPYASRYPWVYYGAPTEVIAKVRAGRPLLTKKGR